MLDEVFFIDAKLNIYKISNIFRCLFIYPTPFESKFIYHSNCYALKKIIRTECRLKIVFVRAFQLSVGF